MKRRAVHREQEKGAVGHPVRRLREERGIHQDVLAKRVGITRETLNRIERGKRRPMELTIRALARSLRVRRDLLVEEIQRWEDERCHGEL